jgi:hypothetical protein
MVKITFINSFPESIGVNPYPTKIDFKIAK